MALWSRLLHLIGRNRAGALADAALQDIRFAWRGLRAAPGPVLAAVLVLALGAGLNTAVLAVAYGVLIRPLPYPEPSEIVLIPVGGREDPDGGIPLSAFNDWQARLRAVDPVAAYATTDYTLRGVGEPRVVHAAMVTERFFDVLRAAPTRGRSLDARDPGIVLSERLLRQLETTNEPIVGRVVTLADRAFHVAGVMPGSVAFPSDRVDLWVIAHQAPTIELFGDRDERRFRMVARAANGIGVEQARADVLRVLAALAAERPEGRLTASADALQARIVAPVRPVLVIFAVGAALVLLVACANAGSLLLARAATRERDIAVRLALGAARVRVLRAVLAEAVLIALAGAALGAILAYGAVRVFTQLAAALLPRLAEVAVDGPVLLASLAVAALVALLCGTAPALHALRIDVASAFRRAGVQGSSRVRRVTAALVVAQIAASVVLLVGAGLLARTVMGLLRVNLGIESQYVLTTTLMLTDAVGFNAEARQPFVSDLMRELGRLPGVRDAGLGSSFPPDSSILEVEFSVGPSRAEARSTGRLGLAAVTPGYFGALGIPLSAGRLLDDADGGRGAAVAVISRSAARAIFGTADPVGRLLPAGLPGVRTERAAVVGVVGDVTYGGLHAPAGGTIYVPWDDLPVGAMHLVLGTEREPRLLAPALRSAIHRVDPAQPVGGIRPLDDVVAGSVALRRLQAVLAASFAGLALVLALVGLAAALTRTVTERRRELAIRTALGSTPIRTVRHVVASGATLAALGIAVGLGTASLAGGGLTGLLYGLGPRDPGTFLATAGLVGVTALVACYLPARRAAGVNPAELLRGE
jgi:putative ABC transport system permease protein